MARDLEFETNSITHPFPPPGQIHGCALAEPSGPWRLTFGLRRLKNFTFFIQIICRAPWISQVQSSGLPLIFIAARSGIDVVEKNDAEGPRGCWLCMKWNDWDAHHLVVRVNLTWKEFMMYKPWGKGLLPLSGLERKKYTRRPATKPSPTRTPTDMDMDNNATESGNENK